MAVPPRTTPTIPPSVRRLQTAAVVVGAAFASIDAVNLYGRRGAMANQYQQGLTFPSDLIQPNKREYYISFNFQKYEKRSIENSPFLRSLGTIRLPLPSNLKDSISVTYSTENLGPMVGAGLEGLVGQTPSGEGVMGAVTAVNRTIGAVMNTAAGAAVQAAQGAAPEVLNAASAYSGIAINPYQTVLFKNPNFKKHSFSWKLMPKDEVESNTIKEIIRTFQFHMMPGVSERVGLFFSYPSMVVISLHPSSEYLYRFKPCVIDTIDINYASSSSPSFFKRTKAPSAITISVQLQEIEYWTNNDYDPNNPTQVFSDIAASAANAARRRT